MTTEARPTPDRLMQFAFGYAPPLLLEAAVKHGVFDRLHEGPKTVAELCAATGVSPRGMRIFVNALVGLQFLAVDGHARFTLTPESAEFLVSSKPGFRGGFFKHIS